MKKAIITLIVMLPVYCLLAQEPVHWHYSTKKLNDKTFELHFTATIDKSWHTYSLTTPDGGPAPTKINFLKNPLIFLKGKINEVGNLHKIHDDAFGVDVKYFDNVVDFVQVIALKANVKTKQSVTIEFMACNDHECLPPKTINFSIALD